jgi:hypothetical protein
MQAQRTAPAVLAAGVAAGATAPLLASWALWGPVAEHQAGQWPCPFRAATGLPCPLCGATRAFVYFFNGDARFVHYNWSWLVVWAAVMVWGAVALARRRQGRAPPLGPLPAIGAAMRERPALVALVPLALLPFWVVALANSGPILGH